MTYRERHAIAATIHSRRQGEPRRPLLLASAQTEEVADDWRAYIAKEKQLKKKLAKEEKERLKRAKENAKKRASRDKLKEQEEAAKDSAAAEKAAKEPPKPKKRRAFAAGDVFRSRVTAGHMVVDRVEINQCFGCTAMTLPCWLRRAARNRTATPSSRRRVDGVEDDAAIQDERAVTF